MKSLTSKYVIVEAETKELAIEQALKELNAMPDEIQTELLEEPRKGLFGFFQRNAKVRVECLRPPVEKAELFLSGCIEKMGFETTIEKLPDSRSNTSVFNLKGDHLGILIGKHGRTIESLQYLVNLVANQNTEKPFRVVLDADGYRKRREEALTQLANRIAKKVKLERRAIKLEPMPAMERKLIHTLIQEDPRLTTYSEGVEPRRSIVVKLK